IHSFASEYKKQSPEPQSTETTRFLNEFNDIQDACEYLTWLSEINKIFDLLDDSAIKSEIVNVIRSSLSSDEFTLVHLEKLFAEVAEFQNYLQTYAFPDSIKAILSAHTQAFNSQFSKSKELLSKTLATVIELSELNQKFIDEMDFRFLYDAD